jgi:uncharacterized membrane protein SirB2
VLPDFYVPGYWLRYVHVGLATLSLALFALRGAWMLAGSARLQDRWVRVVPHVIDTLFLGTGIALAIRIRQYPFAEPWLTAKVLGLVAYIILGSLALKAGRTRGIRVAAFVAALAAFAYIVGVARSRNPWSWLLWL